METYSRTTDSGTSIWDVPRLIKLAATLPTIEVPIDQIRELDQEMWFGGPRKVKATCREVASHAKRIEAADLSHPIIMAADGRVMDGMHRITKAWMQGHTHVMAKRFAVDPEPDRVR